MGNICSGPLPSQGGAPKDLKDDEFTHVPVERRVDKVWNYFHLVKEMGQGASCRVLKVHRIDGDDQFAMKEMKRDDQWNPKLFQTEFDVLSVLRHHNIVQYRESWIDCEHFYIVNELCTGGELFERIKENKKFKEDKAREILNSIISAIEFCHAENIVHRDLKPENIMYRINDEGEDELVIIDFGDAKKVDDTENYNDFVGTAFYLPPEIVRNRKGWELKKSDMWSIGVIAYVLVTGRPPYYGTNHRDILKKILSTDLKFPKRNTLSNECKDFITSLCERKTRKRLAATSALRHKFLTGETRNLPMGAKVLSTIACYHSAVLLKRVLVKLAVDSMRKQRKEKLVECFNEIDVNDDGLISVKELTRYLSFGFNESDARMHAEEVVKQIGSKTEAHIAFPGFREGAISYDLCQKDLIKTTFDSISQGNEYIVVSDLDKYFRRRVEQKSLQQMLTEIDVDKDDRISYEEFVDAMQSPLQCATAIGELIY